VKNSSKVLVMAMVLGLLVWVLDAWVSWMLFPGMSFREMLVEPDPHRTLFLRSVVVLLIFLFGLYSGHLMLRLEKVMEREKRLKNVYLIFSRFNRAMLEEAAPELLAEKACRALTGHPYFPEARVLLCRKDGTGLFVASSRGAIHAGQLRHALEGGGHEALNACDVVQTVSLPPATLALLELSTLPGQTILTPLVWEGASFGWLAVELHAKLSDVERREFFIFFHDLGMDLGFGLKRLEDLRELNRSRLELERSEERLRSLYDNASVGIFRTSLSGEILFLNQAMARALRCESVEEAVSLYPKASQLYAEPEQRSELLKKLRQSGKLECVDIRIHRKDGSIGWLRLDEHLMEPDTADPVLEGFARDVSEQKQAELERMELLDRLHRARKLESIGSLAGGFAHEFNNILQAMVGSAYLAELKASDNEGLLSHLRDIQNSGVRAARLCDQMLTFAGKKPVMLRWIRPDEIIQQACSAMEQNPGGKIRILLDLKAESSGMQGDLSMFRQMLSHLIDNAAESLKEHGGSVYVRSRNAHLDQADLNRLSPPSERPSGEYYELTVKDNGCGMSPEVLGRIFDPFYTTKFQGRGLGLASVLGMVQSFRGGVDVESRPGVGSQFRLYFPCKEMAVDRKSASQQIASVSEPAAGPAKGNLIWIVDDEPLIGQTMSRILQSWGFATASAVDADQFLPRFAKTRNDALCVLLDLTLPGMSGTEIHAEIKLLAPDLPVVMMSGYSQEQTEAELNSDQIADFLHKPFTADSLRKVLENIVPPSQWPKQKAASL